MSAPTPVPLPSLAPTAFHVMTKPIGPLCNLDCRYCFYLEKTRLFPAGENFRMRDDVLETYVRQYIAQQGAPEITFAWQGGEPTLLGVEFFRKVVALQQQHAAGKKINNTIQTNGTLLDDAWCEFFVANRFLVGLSIDGPPKLHDACRVDRKGAATYDKVIRGLRLLAKHGVEFNTLTVVNRLNAQRPLDVYRFLKDCGSRFIQLIPLVERVADSEASELGLDLAAPPRIETGDEIAPRPPVTELSVQPNQYGEFLVTIFDEWVRRDVGKIFVQLFDVTLANWVGQPPGLCVFSETCGTAVAMEHNGDVFSCDHYVYPRHRLGNILERPLGDMVNSDFQRAFGRAKSAALPRQCRECPVLFACRGACPKHRFARTSDGEQGLNFLCAAYRRFFKHVAPFMDEMRNLLRTGRAPALVMAAADRLSRGAR